MENDLHILIVDDIAADTELITRELGKGDVAYTSKWVKSKEEFCKTLKAFAPDIVLCDYKMPDFSVPEALEIIKEISPEIPLIVVSGTIGEDVAVDTMKSGAADYVMKDNLRKLWPAIKRALRESDEQAEHRRMEEALKESEAKFKTIFNESTDGMCLAEVETRRLSMGNPKLCEMMGYTEAELTDLRVDDIHPKDDLPIVLEHFERQAKGETNLVEGLPVKRRDGRVFYADISTSRITLAGKKYLLGSFRDITERKKMTEELNQRMQDLERFSKVTVDRELKMEEVEKEIEKLKKKIKQGED